MLIDSDHSYGPYWYGSYLYGSPLVCIAAKRPALVLQASNSFSCSEALWIEINKKRSALWTPHCRESPDPEILYRSSSKIGFLVTKLAIYFRRLIRRILNFNQKLLFSSERGAGVNTPFSKQSASWFVVIWLCDQFYDQTGLFVLLDRFFLVPNFWFGTSESKSDWKRNDFLLPNEVVLRVS